MERLSLYPSEQQFGYSLGPDLGGSSDKDFGELVNRRIGQGTRSAHQQEESIADTPGSGLQMVREKRPKPLYQIRYLIITCFHFGGPQE